MWELHPVPTIHNDSKFNPSLLGTPTLPRESPRKRKIGVDELGFFQATDKIVDIDSVFRQNSPGNFPLKRLDNSVQIFNLKCNFIIAVYECIGVHRNLHVCLSYHG